MEAKEYIKNVLITEARDFKPLQERLVGIRNIRLLHGALGLSSELAELQELANEDDIDPVHLKEEIGDQFWYMGVLIDELGLDPDKTLKTLDIYFGELTETGKQEYLQASVSALTVHIGHLNDLMKKSVFYGKPVSADLFSDRLDMINFTLNNALSVYGITPSEARATNIAKLKERYKNKFTEAAALERDLAKERAVLEGKG